MRSLALVLALGLIACSGSSPAIPDGGIKCSGAIFDLCATEHDCMSANCHLFMADGFQVCVNPLAMPCSVSSPCANDSSGAPATCNAMGICKPVGANACHL